MASNGLRLIHILFQSCVIEEDDDDAGAEEVKSFQVNQYCNLFMKISRFLS